MKIYIFTFREFVFASVFIILSANLSAQKGYPFISPFVSQEAVDNDNFDLLQDEDKSIVVANRQGVLIFDSRKWDLVPLPYYPVSLASSTGDGSIYAGCRNGFGWLEKDGTGKYSYNSLSDSTYTGVISSIRITDDQEYFISRSSIFFLSNPDDQILSWDFSPDKIAGSFVSGNELFFIIQGKGLYKTENDTFALYQERLPFSGEIIFTDDAGIDGLILGTDRNELFRFVGNSFLPIQIRDSEYLKTSVITDGIYLGNYQLAIGTLMGGVVIANFRSGETISILNYKTGLPDDEVYCLGKDLHEGIWVCHGLGISRIDNRLKTDNLTWYPGLSGNLTNAAWLKGQLFVGSSDGLYTLSEKRQYSESTIIEKTKVPVAAPKIAEPAPVETPAETPSVQESGTDKKLLSKREQRKKKREQKIEDQFVTEPSNQVSQKTTLINKILGTVESTTRVFEKKPETEEFTLTKKKVYSLQSISHNFLKIPGVTGKCTDIMTLKDRVLASTNNGLFEIRNQQAYPVLPNTYISFVSKGFNDEILLAGGGRSFFILKLMDNRWEIVKEFSDLSYPVYSACMINASELWIGSDNTAIKYELDSRFNELNSVIYPINTTFPDKVIIRNLNDSLHFFLTSGIYVFENEVIRPVKSFTELSTLPDYYFSDHNVVWFRSADKWDFLADQSAGFEIPTEYLGMFQSVQDIYLAKNGDLYIIANNKEVFHILKTSEKPVAEEFALYFSGIRSKEGQYFPLANPKISYKNSSLSIEFSAPYYIAPEKTEFSFKIQGIDSEWSLWSYDSKVEYPFLPPGSYTLLVKARNVFGMETAESRLQFTIKPPFWRTTVFYLLISLLVLALFVFIVRVREKNLQRAKQILEQKVKERTAEIERQKNEIAEQKKEITDSIFYARRIQTAILPSTATLNSVLSEHFVLFLPRDIVSGDFYWSTVRGDKAVFLAADCTGHGVPGAFMSMLGVSFLNEIVGSHPLDDAGSVLNELRNHVKSTLAQSGGTEQARDGMDIAMCIIDRKKMTLQFAGAYNPLYLIRNGELTEYKADKMPIGWYDLDNGFKNNLVKIQKDDSFYVFSDGYIDQFGGSMGKKLLSKPFKELLLKIHQNPMAKQKELLHTAFEEWKGNLQQVDDVLVIGFRI